MDAPRFELTAAIALWRGDEILVMKRAAGFSAGGWFLPGGHLEPGERPAEAAVRELREETGIALEPALLALADVMSYQHGGEMAHCLVYNAACPPGAEALLNEEHAFSRWMTPAAFIARFLDPEMLRSRGVDERGLALAAEVARTVRAAARARGSQWPVAGDRWPVTGDRLAVGNRALRAACYQAEGVRIAPGAASCKAGHY